MKEKEKPVEISREELLSVLEEVEDVKRGEIQEAVLVLQQAAAMREKMERAEEDGLGVKFFRRGNNLFIKTFIKSTGFKKDEVH